MATQQLIISVSPGSTQTANLNSTKVKVVSNVSCWYAVGINPVAYATGNCALLPANTVRDINVGPATLTSNTTNIIGSVITGTAYPKIAFQSTSGVAGVSVTEVGFVDFTTVTN